MIDIKDIIEKVKQNTIKGSKSFYKPLLKDESEIIRKYYESQLSIPLYGQQCIIKNKCGTILATGYTRVVIGDYGAYIECSESEIYHNNIKNKWPGKPNRPVKYIWMQSNDREKTKVYFQCGNVSYADYKIGMYYIDPKDIIME